MDKNWQNVRALLQKELGAGVFNNWMSSLHYINCEEGKVTFHVPSSFIANWIETNYSEIIKKFFRKEGLNVDTLSFEFGNKQGEQKELENSAEEITLKRDKVLSKAISINSTDIELPSSPLDKRFTFDRFVVGKPNELAHAAARRVADGGSVTFNPLFLYGGVGLGKTHLMHAIAWQTKNRNPNTRMLYLSAEQFMYRFVQALRFKDMHGFKELFRSVDILMVDDVQFIAGKESTQDEFFHTFNALVEHGKQIVISADRAPGEIDGLEDRIKSRLAWGLVVDLHPTDYELRLGILQSKVEIQSKLHPGIQISSGILEFLAHRISSNVRVLEGSLTRLYAYASLVGREVDIDMAQECLADILRISERKVTIDEIIRKVSEHYNLRMSDMISARRSRVVSRPRQVAMFLAKTLTSKSLPEIGRRFGGRDHTTVIHAVKRIEDLKYKDLQIAEEVEILRRMLEA
ncbi:MAG: chromosomal replication initiator protein DnaA [Rhodobacteraceae bacterium]|nr:MAG: chromosomal replication initiator protein DnaA [Paracoccaceae bacterium]|tara:strand:+ start:1829 stop:3211 length:1383 start_codon:yes stop_codon:yes gene_type:complete